MIRRIFRTFLVVTFTVALLIAMAPADETLAAGETFSILSVDGVGCNAFDIILTFQSTGLDPANTYYQHTTATSNGLVYMDQIGSFVNSNATGNWTVFGNSSGGPTTGSFPMTPGSPVVINIVLESPQGVQLYTSRVELSSCDGVVVSISNAAASAGATGGYDKIGQVRVSAPGTRLYQTPGGGVVRDSNGDEIWVPNQTAHDPSQDTYDVLDQMEVDGTTWVSIFVGDAARSVWIPIGGVVSPIY